MTEAAIWLTIGLVGQAIFAARFLMQWLISEKQKRSVIPLSFWYLSIVGGIILLVYALYKGDPVFIIGQAAGVFVYIRNLYLIKQQTALDSVHDKLA